MRENLKPLILVIDDEASNIDVLSHILRDDYKVLAAKSGVKGIQIALRPPRPDLILLDIKMPGTDGYATCEELKNNPITRNIPVIFVSADTNLKSEQRGLELGAVDYITKPFNNAIIRARVANHIALNQYRSHLERTIDDTAQVLIDERGKLKNSEKLYKTLMEAAPDAIILVNSSGTIELANRAAELAFGYSIDEFIGETVEMLVPDERRKQHVGLRKSFSEKTLLGSKMNLGRLMARKKDGSLFPVSIKLNKLYTDQGLMVIAGVHDLSEEQHIQNQLLHVQKMDAVGQLTSGIAHDFNNILNSILGFLSLAEELDPVAEKEIMQKYLATIRQSGERGRDLIKQLLAFSRGNEADDLKILSLQPLLEEVLQMLKPMLTSSIIVELETEPDVPDIQADAVKISQVLMNLCINARDALHEKGRIRLSLRRTRQDGLICSSCHKTIAGDFVEVCVSDNGEGIDEKDLSRVFQPFYSTKQIGKGTGMGLSVVHGIVHSHGGHILVNSQKLIGTGFHLLFPVAEGVRISDTAKSKPVIRLNGNQVRILVIDDEEAIVYYLNELLTRLDFNVESFVCSRSALEYFEENHAQVDLVITDQTMPDMSGSEIAVAMLKHKPDIPIIMMTGNSNHMNSREAKKLGIKTVLDKPVESEQLLQTVKTILTL